MRLRSLLIAFLTLCFLTASIVASSDDYYQPLVPSPQGNTIVNWRMAEVPELAVQWGWTGEGAWLAESADIMSFTITTLDEYVTGDLTIGNFTIEANNTDVAGNLVLGVWGSTPFYPGLVVAIGQDNLDDLNATAYAVAERVQGNLNGTMESSYESVVVGGTSYDSIVFDYEQDPSGFGEPQRTYLAYDTLTGVLVRANTSITIVNEYILVLEIQSILSPGPDMLLIVGGLSIVAIVVIVIVVVKRR
ncbi:MAG: hypothetical protein KAT22_01430 [Candidatus Thorarchaeota archaeon]|nr:hypothetical protein [Candidatus Thorarchaeota archaeon]